MGLPLRINFNNQDFTLKLLTEKPSSADSEIALVLDGQQYVLTRKDKDWIASGESAPLLTGLVQAIGNALSLRYRF